MKLSNNTFKTFFPFYILYISAAPAKRLCNVPIPPVRNTLLAAHKRDLNKSNAV